MIRVNEAFGGLLSLTRQNKHHCSIYISNTEKGQIQFYEGPNRMSLIRLNKSLISLFTIFLISSRVARECLNGIGREHGTGDAYKRQEDGF